ncbi:alpha/beta-hydrolase [Mycena albidolilacea]|uniref:Carboxypeptidase n=1 Tax=Mycena albidolilacea TaxID=1033008 RepID=A0AAD7ACA5_9AGAR|nr:alpha/beta-hydrolase [Mycena albidolilacea]
MHTPRHIILSTTILLGLSLNTLAQGTNDIPNSFPHAWPGQPKGNFSPEWQNYFEVTDKLPNITSTLPRNFAGNIPVNRAGHPNNTLFFWAFEHTSKNGSLTAPADASNTDPWIIWLQGGPGSSGMIALTTENGPIHLQPNDSWFINEFSWNNLRTPPGLTSQLVCTGFSTSDSTGYVPDEDQTGEDFIGFLLNLVKVFPSLATRPLFLTGESYAGTYIPYITKHIFQNSNPPVNLRKIAIGDGSLGSQATIRHLPILNVIETYSAVISYDQQVFEFFREQTHLCGFDLNLTYPQSGHFPTLNLIRPTQNLSVLSQSLLDPTEDRARTLRETASARFTELHGRDALSKRSDFHERREAEHQQWKRDLLGRANGTIDPFYGCFLLDELVDYAVNFTFPWTNGEFDVYDVPDATSPEPFKNASTFFNDNRTRAALHSPTSKDWIRNFNYPFGSVRNRSRGNQYGDPSVEPIAFLSDLAANASTHNVSIVFYSGNDNALVQHRGTEVIIQNTMFGGTQGFTRKPSTSWFDDDGTQALVFLREFAVSGNGVVGGENTTLANDFLPGGEEIFFGSSTTAGTSTIPAATRSAWASFIATATATGSQVPSDSKANSASQRGGSVMAILLRVHLTSSLPSKFLHAEGHQELADQAMNCHVDI